MNIISYSFTGESFISVTFILISHSTFPHFLSICLFCCQVKLIRVVCNIWRFAHQAYRRQIAFLSCKYRSPWCSCVRQITMITIHCNVHDVKLPTILQWLLWSPASVYLCIWRRVSYLVHAFSFISNTFISNTRLGFGVPEMQI